MLRTADSVLAGSDGPAMGAAALTVAQIVGPPVHRRLRRQPASRYAVWRARVSQRLHGVDFTPDLAEAIGSRRWLRGAGTLLALGSFALGFWPELGALEAAPANNAARHSRDEFRSQAITPLSYGADSGRRMGASARVVPLSAVPERARVDLTVTLGERDGFLPMLQRAGVGQGDAARVAELIGGELALTELTPGTRVAMSLGKPVGPGDPRPLDSLSFHARFDLDLAIVRKNGALVLERKALAVDTTPLRISGLVGASLYRSARAAGAPAAAIQQYLQTLAAHLSFDEISPYDRFDIVVGYKRATGGEGQTGALLYAGLERAGKPLVDLLRWGPNGQFASASAKQAPQTGGPVWPVNGRITSSYGMRFHPVLGYARMHAGVDFGAGFGTPIYAVSDAAVAMAGWRGGHGNYVRLDHGGGLGSGYGHMSRIAVSAGERVRTGQVIGYVGSTGLSTGPHLHYEVYQNGRTVNPMGVRFALQAAVDPREQAALKARKQQLLSLRPDRAAVPRPAPL